MEYIIAEKSQVKRLLDLPRVQLDLDGEELVLLAATVYQNLGGSHPARDRLDTIFNTFEALTGLTVGRLGRRDGRNATDTLMLIEKELNGCS